MTARAKAITYGLLLVLAFAAGWLVNGLRSDAVISGIKTEHAAQVAINASNALERYETMERTKDEAIKAAQERETQFKADAGRASATANGLRGTLYEFRASLPNAAPATVIARADSVAELLGACADEYRSVAEAADRIASDRQTLIDAWPR